MRWQCALLQRWLPEYPDGDLPALGRWWLRSHVARCPDCRRELAEFRQVVAAIQAAPAADPGPEFWRDFSRDLHLKLAQAAQEAHVAPAPPRARGFRLPYLLGAPALAVLLIWVAVQVTGPGASVPNRNLAMQNPAVKMAAVPKQAPATTAAAPRKTPESTARMAATPAVGTEPMLAVALERGAGLPAEEVDISDWDLDVELAGMTDQEKEIFLHNLHQRKKDGSCLESFSWCSWS